MIGLAPEMFVWLAARYLEHRSVTGIVDGFERFLASRGLAQVPDPIGPPAIVFVDLSGFTRMTRERGDASAVAAATSLQRYADATATRHGGRLVKLLGDGAMLRLTVDFGIPSRSAAREKLWPSATATNTLSATRSIVAMRERCNPRDGIVSIARGDVASRGRRREEPPCAERTP